MSSVKKMSYRRCTGDSEDASESWLRFYYTGIKFKSGVCPAPGPIWPPVVVPVHLGCDTRPSKLLHEFTTKRLLGSTFAHGQLPVADHVPSLRCERFSIWCCRQKRVSMWGMRWNFWSVWCIGCVKWSVTNVRSDKVPRTKQMYPENF